MVTKNNEQVIGEGGQIALNRDEEMAFKAAAMTFDSQKKATPSTNPFAKKQEPKFEPSVEEPMQVEEDFPKSATSDVKMESVAASAESKVEQQQPQRPSNTEDDWRKLKMENEHLNNQNKFVDTSQQLQSQDLPLALNKDGTLSFYWFDAHEEMKG